MSSCRLYNYFIRHLDIKIFGRVQGVAFRYSAQLEAEKLGIKGFARNEADGTVLIEVEGAEKDLEKFISWCKNGPETAQVTKVEVLPGKVKGFTSFDRY